jgi:hypothetical protein
MAMKASTISSRVRSPSGRYQIRIQLTTLNTKSEASLESILESIITQKGVDVGQNSTRAEVIHDAVHIPTAENRQLLPTVAAIPMGESKSFFAMIHRMLMTCIQKLLLVFEELIERRLAGMERSRKVIHRCVVKALSIESCGRGTNYGLPATFAKRRSIKQFIFLHHWERLFDTSWLCGTGHSTAPLRLCSQ